MRINKIDHLPGQIRNNFNMKISLKYTQQFYRLHISDTSLSPNFAINNISLHTKACFISALNSELGIRFLFQSSKNKSILIPLKINKNLSNYFPLGMLFSINKQNTNPRWKKMSLKVISR